MNLFDLQPRVIAPTSLDAFETVRQALPVRDLLMVAYVDDYCQHTGYANVTGWELAVFLGRDKTHVRPALTRAKKAGWLTKATPRASRIVGELTCAPYRVAVPRAAIERAIATIKTRKTVL